MEIIQTETNRGNKAILVEGILYRKKNVLKNGDIVYVCSAGNKCTKSITTDKDGQSITTDKDGLSITKERGRHTCNVETSDQKTEAHQLRVRVRKQSGDISRKPITIVRSELQDMNEGSLLPSDIKNAALSLYRERRKNMPALPKSRSEAQDAIQRLSLEKKLTNLKNLYKLTTKIPKF